MQRGDIWLETTGWISFCYGRQSDNDGRIRENCTKITKNVEFSWVRTNIEKKSKKMKKSVDKRGNRVYNNQVVS